MVKDKPKRASQQWWKSLSKIERGEYIAKIADRKAQFRRERSIVLIRDHKGEYSCEDCSHRIADCCEGGLPGGCEHWFNPNSKKKGLLELDPELYKRKRQVNKIIPIKRLKTPVALRYKIPRYTYASTE